MAATQWQVGVQAELNALGKIAKNRNKTLTHRIPEGEYDFESLMIPGNVSLIGGSGASRSVRLRHVGNGDQTLITIGAGYGSLIQGFEILARSHDLSRMTAFRFNGSLNAEISRVRVDLRGIDCVGVELAGRESIKLDTVELRASNPILYRWGDNCVFRNCDLGASGNCSRLVDTVVSIQGMPHQLIFDGYQTWQGGKHAIFGEVDSPTSGQGVNVYNLRYEGSTSRNDPEVAAIHLKFLDRHLENLLVVGSRWTDRLRAFNVQNINNVTQLASRLIGTE